MKKDNRGIIGKRTQEVGDYDQLIKDNPNLVRVSEKVNTDNYIKTLSSTMLVKGSEASRFGMLQVIRTFEAEHERFPNYEEFIGIMKESGSSFTVLPAGQFYAYSAEAGEIMILEEPAE
ncbi:hypothetical protein [Polystyrenella longa]|uniref:hypothetical protein n=1 Tax=Polystyrenella longa TaxID=2528007 RepID=UPI0011A6E037|nr:hypothetical protein [Polystyrenella longa]